MSRTARRAYVIGVLVVGLVLVVPSIAAVVPAFGELGFAAVPAADRGKILAGTSRDATDPCVPLERATTFDSSDAIYIGGYFNRAIAPGGSATVHVFIDDQEAAAVPLAATTQMVGCYYEQDALIGLSPADYRLRVDDEAGVLAEGTFTVK
ncbi:MAG: hypothetical protein ACJ767_14125 [Chloroflexota bacterium]